MYVGFEPAYLYQIYKHIISLKQFSFFLLITCCNANHFYRFWNKLLPKLVFQICTGNPALMLLHVSRIYIEWSNIIFSLLEQEIFFEAAWAVVKIASSLKPNHKNQIKLLQIFDTNFKNFQSGHKLFNVIVVKSDKIKSAR